MKVAGVELPPSLEKFDKAMGQNMRYYTERVAVRVRLAGANQTVKLVATAQGCAAIVGCAMRRSPRLSACRQWEENRDD